MVAGTPCLEIGGKQELIGGAAMSAGTPILEARSPRELLDRSVQINNGHEHWTLANALFEYMKDKSMRT
jgi:hypothetical protein